LSCWKLIIINGFSRKIGKIPKTQRKIPYKEADDVKEHPNSKQDMKTRIKIKYIATEEGTLSLFFNFHVPELPFATVFPAIVHIGSIYFPRRVSN
jgi:hypothetical protein